MSLGLAGTSVDFRDSNANIVVANTPMVAANFNKIEIRNINSNVEWTSVNINAYGVNDAIAATNSPGKFEVVDNATVVLDACSFADMSTFIFNDGTNPNTIAGSTFQRCDQIITGGATFNGGCKFEESINASAVLVSSPANAAKISSSEFISDGTGNGLEITGTAANMTLSDIDFTGYSTTVDADKAIYVNIATGTMTINISGGSGVTASSHVRTAGATVIVSADTTVTFTGMKDNTEVRIYKTSDGSVVDGIENATAGTTDNRSFSWAAASATDVYYVLHNWNAIEPFYQTIRVEGYIVPSTDTSIAIQQQIDRNAE